MIKLFNNYYYPVVNSSDMCLISANTMRTMSSTDTLESMLEQKSINDLTIWYHVCIVMSTPK